VTQDIDNGNGSIDCRGGFGFGLEREESKKKGLADDQ